MKSNLTKGDKVSWYIFILGSFLLLCTVVISANSEETTVESEETIEETDDVKTWQEQLSENLDANK